LLVFIGSEIDYSLFLERFSFTVNLSTYLELYFKDLSYGEGVNSLAFVVLCKNDLTGMPLEEVLSLRRKYYKKRKQLEYAIYFDYQTVINTSSQAELQAMVVTGILDSIEPVFRELKVKDFDLQAFKAELQKAFELVSPDFTAVVGDLSGIDRDIKIQIFDEFIQKRANPARLQQAVLSKPAAAVKEELQMQSVNMNAAAFWRLIEKTKQESGGEQEKHEELLIEALSRLSYPDIGTFHAIYNFYHQLADRPKLITAAGIIEGFLTDDGFEYFRAWLIGEGEKTYRRALANPDNLADVARADEYADFECLMAVAIEAAEKKQERDKEEYWQTYGYPEEYELDEKQIAECQTGIVFDPELDNEVFGWAMHDRDEARFQAMRTKAFPRLIAKCEKA
jgi:hypothetical protein